MKALAKPLHTPHVLKKHYTTGQPGSAGHGEAVLGNGALAAITGVTRNFMLLGISVRQRSLVPWVLLSSELPAP